MSALSGCIPPRCAALGYTTLLCWALCYLRRNRVYLFVVGCRAGSRSLGCCAGAGLGAAELGLGVGWAWSGWGWAGCMVAVEGRGVLGACHSEAIIAP